MKMRVNKKRKMEFGHELPFLFFERQLISMLAKLLTLGPSGRIFSVGNTMFSYAR